MPKNEEKQRKVGRPNLDKVTISIRLSRSVLAQLREAAATTGNLSAFVEEAIKHELHK